MAAAFQAYFCSTSICSVSTPLRGVDLNTAVHLVVQVGQAQSVGFVDASSRTPAIGRKAGHRRSKRYVVLLDKPALLCVTELFRPEGCVIHSFRHSMRDRLRAVECPSDIIDAIGGWTTTGVGQRYGHGQPMDVKAKWMDKLVPL